MKQEKKTTAVAGLILVIIILLIVIAVAVAFLFSQGMMNNALPPDAAATEYLKSLDVAVNGSQYVITTDGNRLYIDEEPSSEEGKILYEYLKGRWSCVINSVKTEKKQSLVEVNITCPGIDFLAAETKKIFTEKLKETVAAASRSSDIYDENLNFRESVINEVYIEALRQACRRTDAINMTVCAGLNLEFVSKKWEVLNPASIGNMLDEKAARIRAEVTDSPEYIPISFHIDENAKIGPVPDQSKFGETNDPNFMMEILSSPYAKKLIGSENLCFCPSLEFYPGSTIRYYLDESILMIQWQEIEQNMCGTFAEIFVADGSQLRRKIAGDSFGDMNFRTTSAFAKETNAVLAIGGDFYNHSRNCGIVVYDRQIFRFDPITCDTCYITSKGDMLFSYRNQWSDIMEAQTFAVQNDVLFSLGFGPVMIDGGIDVTPQTYQWGEVNDQYARAALGMLGQNHYLTMNLNCGGGAYYNYATLRQAADAMVKRNCIKAYTLDGGQTATTAVNGFLVNPVQFGWEKEISDILYFATAVSQ